jgi:hypothetical protein
MSLDAGAREIRRLLTTPNPALGSALRAELRALQHGVKPSTKTGHHIGISSAAIPPVTRVRTIYRDLRRRIAAVDTSEVDVKQGILAALDRVDRSLSLYPSSLKATTNARIAELAREAYWERDRAHTALKNAVDQLR